MLAQIFLAALVPGTLVLIINLFRNRYLNKPLKWNVMRCLAYFLVAISSAGLTAINPEWFNSSDGYFWAVLLSFMAPRIIEEICSWIAINVGTSKLLNKKAEPSE